LISLQDFIDTGALLEGHFRLSSGLHSGRYLQCARLLQWPERAEAAGRELARLLAAAGPKVIVAPALGGLIIGHETARALGVRFVFVERQEGAFVLRRGFEFEAGEPAVVVEDVFTTGKSTRETIAAAEVRGARVVGAGSIVDRGMPAGSLPVAARSLLSLPVPAWTAEECPLCREGVPLDTPGSRFAGTRR
jgi:orotate phosphoribosyltransferase